MFDIFMIIFAREWIRRMQIEEGWQPNRRYEEMYTDYLPTPHLQSERRQTHRPTEEKRPTNLLAIFRRRAEQN